MACSLWLPLWFSTQHIFTLEQTKTARIDITKGIKNTFSHFLYSAYARRQFSPQKENTARKLTRENKETTGKKHKKKKTHIKPLARYQRRLVLSLHCLPCIDKYRRGFDQLFLALTLNSHWDGIANANSKQCATHESGKLINFKLSTTC